MNGQQPVLLNVIWRKSWNCFWLAISFASDACRVRWTLLEISNVIPISRVTYCDLLRCKTYLDRCYLWFGAAIALAH